MKKFFVLIFLFSCKEEVNKNVYSPIYYSSSASPSTSRATKNEPEPCQKEMVHVKGQYCTKVKENCIDWIDDQNLPYARCRKYNKSECIGAKKPMNFCIDKYEFHDEKMMPITNISWTESKKICNDQGKDLCKEDEWNFAAMGEEMLPYAYGYNRYPSPCYIEQPKEITVCGKELCDIRKPVDAFPDCKSPFGVINMNGGVDDWIEVPKYQHSKIQGLFMRSALKGGHAWINARARNLPVTKDHDENFKQIQIGFRCCSTVNK